MEVSGAAVDELGLVEPNADVKPGSLWGKPFPAGAVVVGVVINCVCGMN